MPQSSYLRKTGPNCYFRRYAVVVGEVIEDWFDSESEAKDAAQSIVEHRGGDTRVLMVIAHYYASAKEDKEEFLDQKEYNQKRERGASLEELLKHERLKKRAT